MANLKGHLSRYVEDAFKAFYDTFEGLHRVEVPPLTNGFPADTAALFSMFTTVDLHTPPKRRQLQAQLTRAASKHQRKILKVGCDCSSVEPSPGQSEVDMLQVQLITSRSQQSRILQAPLYYEENRVAALPFAFFMRYYLGFPRLLRKGRPTAPIIEVGAGPVREEELVVPHANSAGYVEEICSLSHAVRATLGPTGKHEISCPSTFAARYRAHGMLTQAAQLAANRLDCVPSSKEPKTQVVLMDQFSSEECRALCPKDTTAEQQLKALDFHGLMMNMAEIDTSTDHGKETLDIIKGELKTALRKVPKDTKGVRLDLSIELPGNVELLCDFSGIHPTTLAVIPKLKKFVKALDLGEDVSAGVVANNPSARMPSPAVEAAIKLKEARYRTLLNLADGQLKSGRRTKTPVLISGVITHLGELSPGIISLVEQLTAVAGKQFSSRSPLSRGLSKAKVTAAFRSRFKDALLAANARGFGEALVAAGNPIAGWVHAPDDACLPDWEGPY